MTVGFVGAGLTAGDAASQIGVQRGAWFFGASKPPFSFDCVIRESHTSELTVTKNPVETGGTVSDHAFMQPAKLEIEAAVGDVWTRMRTTAGQDVSDLAWLQRESGNDRAGRAAVAFQLLLGLQRAAEPFSVQTGLKLYTDMVVESLSAEQDKQTSAILIFRASLCEVIRVSTQTVTYPPRAAGKPKRQADKKKDGGEQSAAQVTEPKVVESGLLQLVPRPAVDALRASGAWQPMVAGIAKGSFSNTLRVVTSQ